MAKLKTKKKKRTVSFLIVPDDYSEPINFKLSIGALKVLAVVGVILFFHAIVGAVFYYEYYVVHKENVTLKLKKKQLEAENSQIYSLAAKSREVETLLNKLKVSLGIEAKEQPESKTAGKMIPVPESISKLPEESEPVPSFQEYQDMSGIQIKSVSHEKSTFHTIFENYPTYLPVDGIISREFDPSEFYEPLSRYHHFGIDIAAKKGSVIHAAGGGSIVFAGWTTNLGNLLIIYHGNNIFSYYAHNLRLLRTSGTVNKGEPIALLGSSGKTSTGPHLHFEIWRDGIPVNPREFIFSLQKKQ